MQTDRGKFFLSLSRIHSSSHHGFRCLQEISDLDMKAVSILANNLDMIHFDYKEGLFLDTETTGLASGTGTLPFMIGLGWFEEEYFIVRQIFIRDFSEESASLSFLLDLAKTKRFLVTFNGKAFDIGLLSTRLIMNRLQDSLSGLPHLDLLHPARRLLGHRIDNSRLVTIEESILGLRREGDLPGSEIPQRYFDWLKIRDGRFMSDVFEHNRLDVISLVTLTIHLAEILTLLTSTEHIKPHDLLAASRLLIDRRNIADAKSILENMICSEIPNIACETRKLLSLIYKRSGLWDKAVKIWEMMITDDPGNYFAAEELAKYYEHRKRDFKKAIHIVNQALSQSLSNPGLERVPLMHRLKRLQIRNLT